jgi:hypothetical protein
MIMGFHTLTFGTTRTAKLSVLRAGLEEIPWYSFLFETEWTPGRMYADRRNRPRANFKGPYRESNPEPPILWCCASTNWWDNVTCQNRIEYFQNLLCYFTSYLLLCVLWFAYWKLPVVSLCQVVLMLCDVGRQIIILIPWQIYILGIK